MDDPAQTESDAPHEGMAGWGDGPTDVTVRRADLLVLLGAAAQLHRTPLISEGDHARLGRTINAVRLQLLSEGARG